MPELFIDYNEFGQQTLVQRGNGTETIYDYDIRGRLMTLRTTADVNSGIYDIQHVQYRFRVDNSIREVTNNTNLDTEGAYSSVISYSYRYDGLNRLTDAVGSFEKTETSGAPRASQDYHMSYRFAANGNMREKSIYNTAATVTDDVWTYAYDENNHAVTNINSSDYGTGRHVMQYDAVGNMIYQSDNALNKRKSMAYDSLNSSFKCEECIFK